MSRGRRTQLATEPDRRTREQRTHLGGDIRESRRRRHWTQAQLAERAGIDRQVLGRIERGSTRLDLDVLQRVGLALDRRLDVSFGRDPFEATADAGHLAMQELVLRLGRTNDFRGTFELATRPAEPWRSIDVVLASPIRRLVILVECGTPSAISGRQLETRPEKPPSSRRSPQAAGVRT